MPALLKPIKVKRVSDSLRADPRPYISGQLKPGEQIMPERGGRPWREPPTVREAIKQLVTWDSWNIAGQGLLCAPSVIAGTQSFGRHDRRHSPTLENSWK